jgi:hypothetical protein
VGELLEKVIVEVSKLPVAEQEAFAACALAELESNRRWAELLAGSQNFLSQLADEAHADYVAGLTEPLDPETM